MSFNILSDYTTILGFHPALIVIIAVWTVIWKGFALWKSSKKNQMIWFIALLVINTLGLLEILYLFVFSKYGSQKTEVTTIKAPLKKKVKSKKK
jgi:hypothetical protein